YLAPCCRVAWDQRRLLTLPGCDLIKATAGLVGAAVLFASPALGGPWIPEILSEFTWTGCYLGLNIGAAWARQEVSNSGSVIGDQALATGSLGGSSGIVGVYGGCNWQISPAWVLGLEGDYTWTQLKDISSAPNLFLNGTPNGSAGINWFHDL